MIDSLKKTMLAGIGAAVVTKERVESILADLVAQGKVSAEDARAMAAKVAAEGKEEFEHASDQLGAKLKDMLARLNREMREELDALEARVSALEQANCKSPPKPEP